MPSLENWDGRLKSLLWAQLSLHIQSEYKPLKLSTVSSIQKLYKHCIETIQLSHIETGAIIQSVHYYCKMKSTKVQNPRRILHILRSMPMRVHRACAGFGQKLYACALFIIDGLGHATWSSKMPVSRSGTAPF